ncbi:MAG TPA: type IV conjugative transfer system protein TraL [Holosporales bacterium]|nr:type IV conjugative transfer system protein TraL [Holosporales bacterium]
MKPSDTSILNYLDMPPRILLWPISEVSMVCLPALMLMVFGAVLWGLVLSAMTIVGMRFFKRSFGEGYLHGVMYWYLPTSKEQFLVTPPSYIREFIN